MGASRRDFTFDRAREQERRNREDRDQWLTHTLALETDRKRRKDETFKDHEHEPDLTIGNPFWNEVL